MCQISHSNINNIRHGKTLVGGCWQQPIGIGCWTSSSFPTIPPQLYPQLISPHEAENFGPPLRIFENCQMNCVFAVAKM